MKKLYYFTICFSSLISGHILSIGDKNNYPSTKKIQAQNSLSLIGNGINFTPNMGQIADINGKVCTDILFKGDGGGADIYLRKTGISYLYTNTAEVTHEADSQVEILESAGMLSPADEQEKKQELLLSQIIKVHRVDMDFEGCNKNISIVNEDELEGNQNFYYAHCPKGITNVHQYKRVTFKNAYNNIDVVYYNGAGYSLKYDLIVQPKADPNQIKLSWKGAENIYINKDGNLVIKTSVNEFYESIPKVYQNINGKIVNIAAEYVLKETGFNYGVSFKLGEYDHNSTLIIDPTTWISYYGGNNSSIEGGSSVCTDGADNAIFTGLTTSFTFPVSAGAHQMTMSGTIDAYVVKMTATGTRVFATYFGGTGLEYTRGTSADGNNDIYVTGFTNSGNFPILAWGGAFMQVVFGGFHDPFISKFSPTGILIWSTFYGGTGPDQGVDITTDNGNNIIFTGYTRSTNFPTLLPFQAALSGGQDAFIVKFNNLGVRQWGSYYGGTSSEYCYGICTDMAGNIYASGETSSNDFPILAAFQAIYGGGPNDAFLIRINTGTGFPVWSTYYGGGSDDRGTALDVDALGNVFMGLYTGSPNNISTLLAFQTVLNGTIDAGLIKFTNAGVRVWGTYLGGTIGPAISGGTDYVTGLGTDVFNNIVVGGDTYSFDFPTTTCSFQKVFLGTEDQFITTFNQQGGVICSGYIGKGNSTSPNNETGWAGGSLAIGGSFLFMTGTSTCNYPVTPGAFQTACGGGEDATFSKLCIYTCGLPNTSASFTASVTTVCPNVPVNFNLVNTSCDTTNTTYLWTFNGSVQGTSVAQNPSGILWSTTGVYTVSVKVLSPCDTITVTKANYITITPCVICALTANTTTTSANCGNNNGTASANPTGGSLPYTYLWNNGQTSQTSTGLAAGNYTVTVTDINSCTTTAIATVISSAPLIGQFTKGTANCAGCGCKEWIMITATGGTSPYSYSWPDGYDKRYKNQLCPGNYNINIKDKNGCSANMLVTAP